MSPREEVVRGLYRTRRRDPFVAATCVVLLALFGLAWGLGDFQLDDWSNPRRVENLDRFLEELKPYPLQGKSFDLWIAVGWAATLFDERGLEAAGRTLALSVLAVVLAGFAGWFLSIFASRRLMTPYPFASPPVPVRFSLGLLWPVTRWLVRLLLLLLRSIPEYLWAFVLITMIGPYPWAAILALAAHNVGILGRLHGEVIEDLPAAPLAALHQLGASRRQIVVLALFPYSLPRFLLFFFYRWETCVREATVLGMLGIASLGYWITDARARNHYDDLLFYIVLGSILVLMGDFLSTWARSAVRRGTS